MTELVDMLRAHAAADVDPHFGMCLKAMADYLENPTATNQLALRRARYVFGFSPADVALLTLDGLVARNTPGDVAVVREIFSQPAVPC